MVSQVKVSGGAIGWAWLLDQCRHLELHVQEIIKGEQFLKFDYCFKFSAMHSIFAYP